MNISIVILSLLSLGVVSFSFQHTINAICFDLEGNNGSDLSSEETNCNIYVMNNGIVTSERGIENDHADDCIGMHKPDPNKHTYVWTTCSDALWIDQMHQFAGDCSVGGRRQLAEKRRELAIFTTALILGGSFWAVKHHGTTHQRHCQAYGMDNQSGWCLSTDRHDIKGWEKWVPSKTCHKMLRLGKPSEEDPRVFGYHRSFNDGRRQLIEEGTQAVIDCEADNDGTSGVCEQLAAQVMKHMIEEGEEVWEDLIGEEELTDNFHAFDKDGSGEIDFEEFKATLKKYSEMSLSEADQARLTALFHSADADSNGSLNLEEFRDLVGRSTEEKLDVSKDDGSSASPDLNSGTGSDRSMGRRN